NQQGAVGLAGGDFFGGGDGDGRIGGVGIGIDANVFDGCYVLTGLQVGLDGLLVLVTGVVAANDDSQLVAHFNSVRRGDGKVVKARTRPGGCPGRVRRACYCMLSRMNGATNWSALSLVMRMQSNSFFSLSRPVSPVRMYLSASCTACWANTATGC